MKFLLLGGTKFLGRHLVEAAQEAGHKITLFNRGQTNPELFPDIKKLKGDRDGDLTALAEGTWDGVIDTCGYLPRIVRKSAELLAKRAGCYAFISSVSVYPDADRPGLTEKDPVIKLEDETTEEIMPNYGGLKALCEDQVREFFPEQHILVRAGLLVGPHDPTGRFTWWVNRLKRGGEVLAPGKPERQVQFIDARDLARWVIGAIEKKHRGTFNVTGPEQPLAFGEMLKKGLSALGAEANLNWKSEEELLAAEVAPWMGLPLWLPSADNGTLEVSIQRACETGLVTRPLEQTFTDTLAWANENAEIAEGAKNEKGEPAVGLSEKKEKELLES